MNEEGNQEPADEAQEAVRLSRDYDFPREAVFNLLTDPKKAAKVWGPEGSVKYLFELDPRPGGAIRIHDGDAGGILAKTSGTIVEIVTPELLVFKSATTPKGGSAPWEALQTVRLAEIGPKRTRVTISVRILAAGSFPGGVESLEEGYKGGWGETLDMLQRELRTNPPVRDDSGAGRPRGRGRGKKSPGGARKAVVLTREYDFPRESIFRMFTDPKKAAKFFSPEGAAKLLFEWDARPGGAIRIHDHHDGVTYKTSGTILELVVPELLVYRSATTPGDGATPFEALQTMKFEALGPTKTRVTILVKILATGSYPGGVESLEEGFLGGWGQTLDILQRELS